MKILSVNSNWFKESDLRLDAEFHISDGPTTTRLIKASGIEFKPLHSVTKSIFKGQIFKRCYVKDTEFGMPFLSASDMVKSDVDSGLFLSKKYAPKSELLEIKKDCILISRSGTLGLTVYTNKIMAGVIGSDDLIRIIPDNNELSSGFLYAFLASRYGYSLITQSSYGGVIKHIEPHHLEDISIPIIQLAKRKLVDEKIKEAAEFRYKAHESLKEATSYFEKLFPAFDKKEKVFLKKSNEFNFSWVGRNNDIIPENWISKIKSQEHHLIKSISSRVFCPAMFKHIYLKKDNGFPFFTGAELAKAFRLKRRFLAKSGVKNINDYVVHNNDLVIYKSGPRNGMIGDVFLIDKALDNSCLSDHVIRILIKDQKINFWCFAFLKSKVGKRILHNLATGTAILFITPERIENLVIPAPDKNFELIVSKVEQYISSFNEAHRLEREAIEIIEKEIESWQK